MKPTDCEEPSSWTPPEEVGVSDDDLVTELPDSAVWKFDYHAPPPLERDGHRGLKYMLEISDKSGSQEVDFEVYNWELGWNTVGQLNLSAGEVKVHLLGTSQRGPLWADSIRWSRVEND